MGYIDEDGYGGGSDLEIADTKAKTNPSCGITVGPYYLSETGHLHRSNAEDRHRVDCGIIFQNVAQTDIEKATMGYDGITIDIAPNHYYDIHGGFISLHRHYAPGRKYLSDNATIFLAEDVQIKKILTNLLADNKMIENETKLIENEVEAIEAEAVPIAIEDKSESSTPESKSKKKKKFNKKNF